MTIESIEEIRVFVQVVEAGSIAAASKLLRLPPVTVGRRLSALERRLQRRLLNRSTRSQSLSDAGREFLPYAQQILLGVDQAEQFLDAERGELDGQVRLGVVSALAPDVVAALKPVLADHPGLRVQIRVVDRMVNLSQMGLDLLFIGGALPDSDHVARPLASVVPVLAASAAYLERKGTPTTPEELASHDAIVFMQDPPALAWQLVAPDGSPCTVPLSARIEIDASTTMASALQQGLGVGMITQRFVHNTPGMVQVLPGYTRGTFSLFAIFPHRGRRSRRIQVVVDAVEAEIRRQQQRYPPARESGGSHS